MIAVTEIGLVAEAKPGEVLIEFETPPTRAIRWATVSGTKETIEARNVFGALKPLSKIRRATMIPQPNQPKPTNEFRP